MKHLIVPALFAVFSQSAVTSAVGFTNVSPPQQPPIQQIHQPVTPPSAPAHSRQRVRTNRQRRFPFLKHLERDKQYSK